MVTAWNAENNSGSCNGSIADIQLNITVIYLFCQSRYAIDKEVSEDGRNNHKRKDEGTVCSIYGDAEEGSQEGGKVN